LPALPGGQRMEGAASAIVGRDAELATIQGFLQDLPSGPRALLIQGEAGIGKTTLWRAAISAATHRGYTVLPSKPVEIETKLSFTGLGDLLEQHVEEVLLRLPDPQRRALEIALLRADAAGSPPDQRAVSLAVLSALRVLASSTPLLVAIDDVQWLDPSSASVLAFAARRIDRGPVGVVACLRLAPGHADPLGLDEAFPETRSSTSPWHLSESRPLGASSRSGSKPSSHHRLSTFFRRSQAETPSSRSRSRGRWSGRGNDRGLGSRSRCQPPSRNCCGRDWRGSRMQLAKRSSSRRLLPVRRSPLSRARSDEPSDHRSARPEVDGGQLARA
jgi:AAA ATPase domain